VPCAPPEEQTEIVFRIEAAFARMDQLATEAERAGELVTRLDRAVLAKAFAGELLSRMQHQKQGLEVEGVANVRDVLWRHLAAPGPGFVVSLAGPGTGTLQFHSSNSVIRPRWQPLLRARQRRRRNSTIGFTEQRRCNAVEGAPGFVVDDLPGLAVIAGDAPLAEF
jgi:hypothetical protein